MIRLLLDGEEIHTLDDRAYRSSQLNLDFTLPGDIPVLLESIPLPVVRDITINLTFGKRPDTDLAMLTEHARQETMDADADNALADESPEKPEVKKTVAKSVKKK